MINIYTVFLSRFDLLEFQIKSFVKNIENNFILNVLDNSLKKEDSKKLKFFCKKKNINYLKYPNKEKFRGLNPSINAYKAYQYIADNFINLKSDIICFVDNDIFLTKKIDIKSLLKNFDFAGLKQSRKNFFFSISYFWQGLIFINLKKFNLENINLINFKPTIIPVKTDTAGSTYKIFNLYGKNSKKILFFENTSHLKKNKLKKFFSDKLIKDYDLNFNVEFIHKDYFLHYGSGSNWRGKSFLFEKKKIFFIKKYLKTKGIK